MPETTPFPSRLIVAAAPGHPLAGQRDLAPRQLAGQRWLLGPPDLDPTTGAAAQRCQYVAWKRPK